MSAEISEEARVAVRRAATCIDERRFLDALPHAEEAVRLAPDFSSAWWDLAVARKHARDWHGTIAACERVLALAPDDDNQGMHWNAGIAATALGDWPRARAAWRAAGIKIPDGDGSIAMKIGATPIRVPFEDPNEVLWCERIDPARAIIRSVPTPDCGRRYGDLVLHDGEPRGERMFRGDGRSVFDELDLLEASPFGTWEIGLEARDADARDAIVALFDDTDVHVEDWTESLRMLCKACSLGEAHEAHAPPDAKGWISERRLGAAARHEDDLRPLRRALGRWRKGVRSVARVL